MERGYESMRDYISTKSILMVYDLYLLGQFDNRLSVGFGGVGFTIDDVTVDTDLDVPGISIEPNTQDPTYLYITIPSHMGTSNREFTIKVTRSDGAELTATGLFIYDAGFKDDEDGYPSFWWTDDRTRIWTTGESRLWIGDQRGPVGRYDVRCNSEDILFRKWGDDISISFDAYIYGGVVHNPSYGYGYRITPTNGYLSAVPIEGANFIYDFVFRPPVYDNWVELTGEYGDLVNGGRYKFEAGRLEIYGTTEQVESAVFDTAPLPFGVYGETSPIGSDGMDEKYVEFTLKCNRTLFGYNQSPAPAYYYFYFDGVYYKHATPVEFTWESFITLPPHNISVDETGFPVLNDRYRGDWFSDIWKVDIGEEYFVDETIKVRYWGCKGYKEDGCGFQESVEDETLNETTSKYFENEYKLSYLFGTGEPDEKCVAFIQDTSATNAEYTCGNDYSLHIHYCQTQKEYRKDYAIVCPESIWRGDNYEIKAYSTTNSLDGTKDYKLVFPDEVNVEQTTWGTPDIFNLWLDKDYPYDTVEIKVYPDDATEWEIENTPPVGTKLIEVLGSTALKVEAPDEVEEETEYTVDVFFYYDGREIQVTVPEGVNMIPGDTWLDEYMNIALQEYTLIVDEEYEEASFTLTVSDGHTTFSKEINVTEKEIIMPTITFSPSALDFVQAGETKTLTVTYTDTTTEFINRPYSTDLGVTIHETSLTQNGTNVTGTYAVTVESTIYATTIPLIFSCSSPQGASSTATLLATQQGGSPDTGETRGWITLDKYIAYVPADGGEVFVKAHFGYPVGKEVLSCRVRNANGVYPIAWCRGILTGGEVEDDGTVGIEDWKFVFKANTATESRTAVCVFSYTNFYGEKGSATLTIVQDAGDGEDVTQEPSEIVPYVSLIKMTEEGENYYGATTDYFNVNYFKIAERDAPSVNVDWFRITDSQVISEGQFDVLVRYWYECDANSLTNPRNAEITLSGTDEYGETVTARVSVQQARHTAPEDGEEGEGIPSEPGVYIGQIWKDVVYTFGNLEKVSYTIWKGNTMIFKGISWLRPSTGVNSIMVNRICQNYLGVPELKKGSVGTIVGYDTFTLRNGEGTVTYATYKFVNAWNYNDEFRTGLLSYPILDRPFVVRGQMTPFSVFGAGEEVKVAFGVTYKNYVDDFGNVTEGWGSTDYVNDGIYHDYFTVTSREKDYISSVYIGNREYQVEEPCRIRYVLYYLNPWGGLDWFPITGNYRMTDNITQYTYTRNYNNTTREFGKSRYLAEIERKYTLTTGWLKQSESDRMWYLLESNLVYLHDLQEDKVIPVTIDDTTVEHKRKDRMNKIIQYTFTVTESQLRERI